jgi:hypothetical protein
LIAKRRGIELVGSSTCRFDLFTKAFRRPTLEWIMAIGAVKSFVPLHAFDHFTVFHVAREQIATVLKAPGKRATRPFRDTP